MIPTTETLRSFRQGGAASSGGASAQNAIQSPAMSRAALNSPAGRTFTPSATPLPAGRLHLDLTDEKRVDAQGNNAGIADSMLQQRV